MYHTPRHGKIWSAYLPIKHICIHYIHVGISISYYTITAKKVPNSIESTRDANPFMILNTYCEGITYNRWYRRMLKKRTFNDVRIYGVWNRITWLCQIYVLRKTVNLVVNLFSSSLWGVDILIHCDPVMPLMACHQTGPKPLPGLLRTNFSGTLSNILIMRKTIGFRPNVGFAWQDTTQVGVSHVCSESMKCD